MLALGISGCDYWPPALQAQIEQLQSETQIVTMENTQLQSQVTELSQAKQDLQSQVDELSRINREKSSTITNLQHQIDALRTKTAKTSSPAKKTVKPATKSSPKKPVQKKTTTKR